MPQGAYTQIDELLRCRLFAQSISLFPKRKARSMLTGNEPTHFRGRGMDFEEVRLYQAGDDIRSIDWRVTARTQVTHTKIYREERERPVLILVDQRSPLFFGSQNCFKSVLAAEIAATLAWAALARGDRLGGLVLGDRDQRDIKPKRSKHAVLEFLHQIHLFNQQLKTPFTQQQAEINPLIQDARRIAKPGSAVFIISDFQDLSAKDTASVYQLTRHTDVTFIQVFDPLEANLMSPHSLSISNGTQQIVLPTQEKQFQSAFHQDFENRQEQLKNLCQRMGIALLHFSTGNDLTRAMQKYFSNAGHNPTLTLPLVRGVNSSQSVLSRESSSSPLPRGRLGGGDE
jgi:uncharacterized protein (DUF58 family)